MYIQISAAATALLFSANAAWAMADQDAQATKSAVKSAVTKTAEDMADIAPEAAAITSLSSAQAKGHLGHPVLAETGDTLGTVQDFILDDSGAIEGILVAVSDVLAGGDAKSVIVKAAMARIAPDALKLGISPEDFAALEAVEIPETANLLSKQAAAYE